MPFDIKVSDVSLGVKSNSFDLMETENKLLAVPNPINNNGTILFMAEKGEEVKMVIYNYLGQLVYEREIISKIGENRVPIEKGNLPSGMYLCKIVNGSREYDTLKIILN